MLFVSLAIVSIYAVFILTCLVEWLRNRSFTGNSVQKTDITLSLIVCCKNEEKRLSGLLASIEGQIEVIDEVVFASDHSTDSTESILNAFAQQRVTAKKTHSERLLPKPTATISYVPTPIVHCPTVT